MNKQKKDKIGKSGTRERRGLLARLKSLYLSLKKENLAKLLLVVFILVALGGALVFMAELKANPKFARFFDSLWWAIVTITTVGYGDISPVTPLGRILAVLLMLMGVVATSILSGTIASMFVDRKLKEGKGLQDINMRGHTVICGWNKNAESILEGLALILKGAKKEVVLVNSMDPEEFQALSVRHPGLDIRFVRGDFVSEKVLKRAALNTAGAAILLSDVSGGNTLANADERTILATLAIKSINPDITTSAELNNPENEQHLRRAKVDDILVNGEFNGFLLASATMTPAIPQVTKELLSFQSRGGLKQMVVPMQFVGRSFRELSDHFLKIGAGILIGLLSEEKKMSLDDILSEGSSAIDAFIKQKFAESELDVFEEEKQEINITLNPGADYTIKDTDSAFLIGSLEGSRG
jgi:voltage-gated potassium channel